jgi:NADPH:quinone reductase-like Zn-dependent oxidoreductase
VRAWEIRGGFGLENLTLAERPDPRPGPGQVLIRVRAVSLNFRDLLTVQGKYNPKQKLPLIPCSDGAGEVVAVGDGVTRVKPGDRVCGIFAQRWIAGAPNREKLRSTLGGPFDGMLAELVVLHEDGVVLVPPHLTNEEAATLPCAGVTAWSALVTQGGLTAGDTVLLQGTGGVSILALQLAQLLGVRALITSSSDEKLERARQLGAAGLINYQKTPEWSGAVRELTHGNGVDLVVEVGGAGTLEQSLRSVRMGGTVCLIGNLTGLQAQLSLALVFMQQVRVQGILVGHREGFEAMNRAIAAHGMRPVIDRTLGFDEAPAAFAAMAGGGHFGKICLRVG